MHERVEVRPQWRQPMRRRANASDPPRAGFGADFIIGIAKHLAQQIEMTRAEQHVRIHRHPSARK